MEELKGVEPLKSPKKEAFCQAYARTHNATKAAQAAGYSEKTAYSQGARLLKSVEVCARVRAIEGDILSELGITPLGILERVNEIAKICEKTIKEKTKNGEEIEIPVDARHGLKALEMLGAEAGLFGENIKAQVNTSITEADRRLLEKVARRHDDGGNIGDGEA